MTTVHATSQQWGLLCWVAAHRVRIAHHRPWLDMPCGTRIPANDDITNLIRTVAAAGWIHIPDCAGLVAITTAGGHIHDRWPNPTGGADA